jgi:hypothetical protein
MQDKPSGAGHESATSTAQEDHRDQAGVHRCCGRLTCGALLARTPRNQFLLWLLSEFPGSVFGSAKQIQQKTPRRGGGALLGLLQGGENCERGDGKPDVACPCGVLSDYLRLKPVGKGADWRITGASSEAADERKAA